MKKLIISIIVISAFQVGFSQKKDENIGSEVVNIVKPYTPTISDAFKIKQSPTVEQEIVEPKIPIKFQIFSFLLMIHVQLLSDISGLVEFYRGTLLLF